MAPLRIAHVLGTAFLIAVFLAGGPATRAVAQSPRDLYQTGPDPIAPELPPADRDLNEDAQTEPPLSGQESSSKEAEQPNDKDDLDLLDLNL
ncbi:MAG TPA: hypothetical protein VJL29_13190 [Thermoguttaceae bacterium]|nr:hypothetical protein [Thermoguttaceae bacterium]